MEKEYKERIEELEERVEYLEKKEGKRKTWNIIKLCIRLAIIGLLAYAIWRVYDYTKNVVEPINEVVGTISNTISNTTNTIDFSKVNEWIKVFE